MILFNRPEREPDAIQSHAYCEGPETPDTAAAEPIKRDTSPALYAPLIGFQVGRLLHVPDPSVFAVKDESWNSLREAIVHTTPDGMTPEAHFAERLSAIGR